MVTIERTAEPSGAPLGAVRFFQRNEKHTGIAPCNVALATRFRNWVTGNNRSKSTMSLVSQADFARMHGVSRKAVTICWDARRCGAVKRKAGTPGPSLARDRYPCTGPPDPTVSVTSTTKEWPAVVTEPDGYDWTSEYDPPAGYASWAYHPLFQGPAMAFIEWEEALAEATEWRKRQAGADA